LAEPNGVDKYRHYAKRTEQKSVGQGKISERNFELYLSPKLPISIKA